MRFTIDEWKIDLGQTPIENMFLNSYMLMAPGDAVKAYLYGYRHAFEKSEAPSHAQMAENLGVSEETLSDIWKYWEQMGVIRRLENGEIMFLSLRQLYLGLENPEPDYFAEPKELVQEAEDPQTKMMIEQIESVLTVPLRPKQTAQLLEALQEYPVDKEVAVMSFTYAFHSLTTRDFDYALGVWRKWYIAGVRTMGDLEKHLEKEKQQKEEKRPKKVQATGFTTPGQGQDRLSDEELKALVAQKIKKQRRRET